MGGSTPPQRQSTISSFFKPVAALPSKNAAASTESPNKENNSNGRSSLPPSSSLNSATKKNGQPPAADSTRPLRRDQGKNNRSSTKKRPRSSLVSDGDYEENEDDVADDDAECPLLPKEVEEEQLTLSRRRYQSQGERENRRSTSSGKDTLALLQSPPLSSTSTAASTAPSSSSSSSLANKFAFKKNTIATSKNNVSTPSEGSEGSTVPDQPEEAEATVVEMDEEKAARRAKFLDKLGNFRPSAAIPPSKKEESHHQEAEEDPDDGDSSFVMTAKSGAKRRRLIVFESEDSEGDGDDYVDEGSDYADDDKRSKTKKMADSTGGTSKSMVEKVSPTTTPFQKHSSSTSTDATTSTNAGQDAWKWAFLGGGGGGGGSSSSRGKKDKSPFTPLEKQFIEIKQQYPDAILCIEVGYKFKFFGEDAQIASRELSIAHFMDHNFYTASIPVHRLDVHVRRLVHAGYKVGVVRQMETAALKSVGDNKSAPFTRKLTNLYTKATFLESLERDMEQFSSSSGSPADSSSHYIACIVEELQGGMGADERVRCSILAVQPATGDIIYDEFQDMYMRSELETRLLHIQPAELLLPEKGLSPATEKLVKHLSMPNNSSSSMRIGSTGSSGRHSEVRTERSPAFHKYSKAFNLVSEFYSNNLKEEQQRQQKQQRQDGGSSSASSAIEDRLTKLMTTVLDLPHNVIVALWAMIDHLIAFGLAHVFVQTKYFQPFHTMSHMLLNGNTLNNLEIFRNQTDWSTRGSLLEILDQTKTGFGRRLLKKWVGKPLVDRRMLQQRADAVEEILAKQTVNEALIKVEKCLTGLMDLEKGVCRIHYGYASPKEFWLVLKTFDKILRLFPEQAYGLQKEELEPQFGLDSSFLNELIASLTVASDSVQYFLNGVNEQAAKNNDRVNLFDRASLVASKWPEILQHEADIQATEEQLRLHLKEVAKLLREPRLEFTSVAGVDYLVEVKNKDTPKVPKSWVKISGTKQVSRFHTPDTTKLIHAKAQHQERLTLRCTEAFKEFCKEFSGQYEIFRDVVQALATLDCLFSLAAVARRPGYCKAEYVDDDAEDEERGDASAGSTLGGGGARRGQRGRGASTVIEIKKGRHPMVEQLLMDSTGTEFVPNDVDFGKRTTRRVSPTRTTSSVDPEQDDKWTSDEQKTLILTGPNMGGKSCYIRQVALLCLMAQIGSYVPAERARLSLLDAIYTRMGASDNLFGNESTFMVELQETSDILRMATPKSLIILDELGRGTSTLDGVAIAYAVLKHCVTEIRATTLFVTHYPSLAEVASEFPKGRVRNYHMGFMATKTTMPTTNTQSKSGEERGDEKEEGVGGVKKTWVDSTTDDEGSEHDEIVFLYNLVEGVSLKSYGLNVARLAKLPPSLIARAKEKSKELEVLLERRRQKKTRIAFNTNNEPSLSSKKRPRDDNNDLLEGRESPSSVLSDQSAKKQQAVDLLHRIWACQTSEQAQEVFDLCR